MTGPRCRHEPKPLCPKPWSTEGRLNYLLCPLKSYVVCEKCGRVGWYIKYHGELRWFSQETSKRKRQEAKIWNKTEVP